jgi:hypothetical protein
MFSCTFGVIQILALHGLFLGRFQRNLQVTFSWSPTGMPSFVEKYPQIKYIIFDGTQHLAVDLCERSFKLRMDCIETSHWSEN